MAKQKIEDAIQEVYTKPLVPLWPTTATLLGIGRAAVYSAAQRGEIDTDRSGRLLKAISSSLRQRLKLEPKQRPTSEEAA